MSPASDHQKRFRYFLPVVFICFVIVLVSISGCLSGIPGLTKSSTSQNGVPSSGMNVPPVYNTSQAQGTGTAVVSCRQGLTSCGGNCVDTGVDIGNCDGCGMECPSNAACRNSQCYCKDGYEASASACVKSTAPAAEVTGSQDQSGGYVCEDPSLTVCGKYCIDLKADPSNCGSCDKACANGEQCSGGQCVSGGQQPPPDQQPAGGGSEQTTCNGQNVDLMTDSGNCGACQNSCGSCKVCVQGSCQDKVGVCNYCTQNSDCVDPVQYPTKGYDAVHYAWVCGYSPGFNNQACITDCQSPWKNCGTTPLIITCVNPQTDPKHCGSCENACTTGQTCTNGKCSANIDLSKIGTSTNVQRVPIDPCASQPGTTNCNGQCYNLQTDNSHCGLCTKVCPFQQFCQQGSCTCGTGKIYCGSTCVNANTVSNCGSCGTTCTGGSCTTGVCVCPTGYMNSGGLCTKRVVPPQVFVAK